MATNKKATMVDSNEISVARTTAPCKTLSNDAIKEILFTLVTDFDASSGSFVIAGTADNVEDTCINKCTFVHAVDHLIDSIRDNDCYGILNNLAVICSKKYSSDLAAMVTVIEKTKDNFLKEMPLNNIIFKDEILNIYWRSLSLSMKKASVLLITAIAHMCDKYFIIDVSNYNGDTCNLFECMISNRRSFFDGRLPE